MFVKNHASFSPDQGLSVAVFWDFVSRYILIVWSHASIGSIG